MFSSISLRRIGVFALLSFLFSFFLSSYFASSVPGFSTFFCSFLLLLFTSRIHVSRKTWAAAAVFSCLYAMTQVFGYSFDRADSYVLVMKNIKTMLYSLMAFLSLAVLTACFTLLLLSLFSRIAEECTIPSPNARTSRFVLVGCALLIFLGSLPYLALYWPGLNIFDTHDQLLQFFGYPSYIGDGSALSDHHPVFLTVVYGLFIRLGNHLGSANIGQALYSFSSLLFISLCFGYGFSLLYRCGLRAAACFVLAGTVAVSPIFSLYSFNMCKDVSAAPFSLLLAAQMFLLWRSRGEVLMNRKYLLFLAGNVLLLMMVRKSAWYVMLISSLFLLIFYRRYARYLAASLLGACIVFLAYSHLLLPALHVIPGETREMFSVPFQQVARVIYSEEEITEEELLSVQRVLSLEACENYDPRLSDPVKDTSNPHATAEDFKAFFSAWASLLRHKGTYLEAWLNMVYGYFYPSDSNTIVCLTLNSPDQGELTLTQDPSFEEARLGLFNTVYYVFRRLPVVSFFFYVPGVTWTFLFLLLYLFLHGGVRRTVPWIFFVGCLGICFLSPKSGEIRYLLPVLYILPFLLGASLLPDLNGGEVHE